MEGEVQIYMHNDDIVYYVGEKLKYPHFKECSWCGRYATVKVYSPYRYDVLYKCDKCYPCRTQLLNMKEMIVNFLVAIQNTFGLLPAVAYQSGCAIEPFVIIERAPQSPILLIGHWHACHDLVIYSRLVDTHARRAILFVVKYLPNCWKDVRVMIGKLLWSRYRLAWTRGVPLPDKNKWKTSV
jgi:hypothetical protein